MRIHEEFGRKLSEKSTDNRLFGKEVKERLRRRMCKYENEEEG